MYRYRFSKDSEKGTEFWVFNESLQGTSGSKMEIGRIESNELEEFIDNLTI